MESSLPQQEGDSPYTFFLLLSMIIPLFIRLYIVSYKFHTNVSPKIIKFHNLELRILHKVHIKILSATGQEKYSSIVGQTLHPSDDIQVKESKEQLEVEWQGEVRLTVYFKEITMVEFYELEWKTLKKGPSKLKDSVAMLGSHWYGLGHVINQPWPMEKWDAKLSPVVTGESHVNEIGTYFGGVQERLWLNSSGVGVFVDFDVPLFTSINHNDDREIVFCSQFTSPYLNSNGQDLFLTYTLCNANDPKEAYLSLAGSKFPKPSGIPKESMFRFPIWSTWAQYKKEIDQDKVVEFAGQICKHGFRCSQLELDDDWTPAYGDWEFNKSKFPDPSKMVEMVKNMGFLITIWVHPFANVDSKAFEYGWEDNRRYWIGDRSSGKPSIVSWWNGKAGLLDVTNPDAVAWLTKKLEHLRVEYGFDSFKIDAGEANRLSKWRKSYGNLDNPNRYTKQFVQWAHNLDLELEAQEVRVGVGNQDVPMFFRLEDKDSNWTSLNGLKTLIPHVLTQGLLGYPFVLPDMIGGNAYAFLGFSESSKFPQRELFIRWIEVNALMPAMQFSIVPWMYDEEVVRIAKKMCDLHEQYGDFIISLAKEATKTGAPICRPLWWVDSLDEVALTISTEFLLGDDVLVAPVLDQGAVSRDVYLPKGCWKDEVSGSEYEGAMWIRDHPAPLDVLPHFTRVVKSS